MSRTQSAPMTASTSPLSYGEIVRTWWPLAASWLLMALEGPAVTAIIARLADPEVHLAAYGGLVLPLAFLVEAPIIMLLSASTALSKDWASYQKIRRFMHVLGGGLTVLHFLVAFTPLYDVFATGLMGVPPEILEPGRIGLQIVLPWTWSIAYRRFNQGVLIRAGHSLAVGLGTLIRLAVDGAVLAIGYFLGSVPGIVVASAAIVAGVAAEAVYAGIRVRPVLRDAIRPAAAVEPALTLRTFLRFYVPLSLTSLINLISRPIVSGSLSRMPQAIDSLAAWSVVTSLVFLVRSFGVGYNETVIALIDRPESLRKLRRFSFVLAGATTLLLLLFAATPLAGFWFGRMTGLSASLALLARQSVWLALILPALSVTQSLSQGILLHSKKTRALTEAVVLFLIVDVGLLAIGVAWGKATGLFVGVAALSIGEALRNVWLNLRSRPARKALLAAETAAPS